MRTDWFTIFCLVFFAFAQVYVTSIANGDSKTEHIYKYSEVVTENGTFCPICKKEGKKSELFPSRTCMSTAVACSIGHYNKKGKWIPGRKCNTQSCTWSCSEGHEFTTIESTY